MDNKADTMEVKLCKTCKYWEKYKDGEFTSRGFYAGKCSNAAFVYDEATPKNGLSYWDYESYRAGFETGEDFGCIHWEPKWPA